MLTSPDETLRHQLPTTFDHVGTSDPRFYDRYFFGVHDPGGRLGLHLGLGLYTNMNVMDGYACVVVDRTIQHNLRVSRLLRPRIDDMSAGPIRYHNTVPHRSAA